MIALIVVAFVFAVVASLIAFSRGRNSLGWFLAGLLIGPFALIVAVLPCLPREGQYIRCPSCQEVVAADAAVCRYCRKPIEHEAESAEATAEG